MLKRGIIHVHSRYSCDSVTSIRTLLNVALTNGFDFVVVADHDSLEGARALSALAEKTRARLEVPLAAEYGTDHGDVIAAFLRDDVASRSFVDFVAEVRSQGGLVLLPHPYEGHVEVEWMAEQADLIEVFNTRIPSSLNERALALAQRLRKPMYYASDAHLARNLTNVVLFVEGNCKLENALVTGRVWPERISRAGSLGLGLSQCIKAWKRHDTALAGLIVARVATRVAHTAAQLVGIKVDHSRESP